MAYCRFCGALLAEGARFCHLCGKEIATAHHCPQCGALLPEESRFCSACGAAVAGAAPAASGTPQHHQGRPPEIPLGRGRTITLPAPQVAPAPPPSPVPPPDSAPSQGYACLLCRIREISPAPCSAFSAQTAAVTHSKAPECTAFWNRFP